MAGGHAARRRIRPGVGDAREGELAASSTAVGALEEFPYDDRVRGLYATSADLYVESVRAYRAAVMLPAGELRDQVVLLARRLRELGDRIFDRGHALVKPFLHDPPVEGIDIRLPEEVPMWEAEGLAVGPPLGPPPPPPLPEPPLRQATRPQQDLGAWMAAVRRAGVPEAAVLPTAVRNADADALRGAAEAFVAAAEVLRAAPDPRRDRERSARVRLALLLYADAARAAQSAALLDDPDGKARLAGLARRTATLADAMYRVDLGNRDSGLAA